MWFLPTMWVNFIDRRWVTALTRVALIGRLVVRIGILASLRRHLIKIEKTSLLKLKLLSTKRKDPAIPTVISATLKCLELALTTWTDQWEILVLTKDSWLYTKKCNSNLLQRPRRNYRKKLKKYNWGKNKRLRKLTKKRKGNFEKLDKLSNYKMKNLREKPNRMKITKSLQQTS